MREQVLMTQVRERFMTALRDQSGFTLIELLVTLLMGMIILGALFTIEATTLHQTSRFFSKADATQHARVGIEQIENELHSACITDAVTPVLPNSTSSSLMFVSQYGNAAALTPVEHVITYDSSSGNLTDTTYAETGVTTNANGNPVYSFSATPSSSRVVISNVSQTVTGGTAQPIFQYYAYQEPVNAQNQPYTAPDGNPYEMLIDGTSAIPGTSTIPTAQPLATPLTTASAATAAEVMISLTAGPSGGTPENTHLNDVNDDVQDGVVLRLTPAPNEAGNGAVFLPCQ
ncbi:MAG: prepilin-type N-terminal cleavage/methylation domain-containing protein [Solirubrobacterales bacterium]|nr:prepilin-type N-terminal cleavage/methylation domain-containing protein [Solirubrobacterales bacterium]